MGRSVVGAAPKVILHDDILVVRDDLFPGGTKARFISAMFDDSREYVYASPAEGGSQTSLATVLGNKTTIFVAKRKVMHPRTKMAERLGAKIVQVPCGYLNVVQAAARKYAEKRKDRYLLPFGLDTPEAVLLMSKAAKLIRHQPDEVWCAAGSGTLVRSLASAWPLARMRVVQVGRTLSDSEVAGAKIFVHPLAFGKHAKTEPPFPSDPHYDAKAWEICVKERGKGKVLFWNVVGPAT